MANKNLDSLFAALSDTTRRAMIARLCEGSASVSELAAPHQMALPSFLKHLDKLEKAGLVTSRKTGRVRMVTLEAERLSAAQDWIDRYKSAWSRRLDQLERLAEDIEGKTS